MDKLEILGGEEELVFRIKHSKSELRARIVGPREIVGIPGEWVDAVFKLESDIELLEMVLDHLESKRVVDRVVVKVTTPKNKLIKTLKNKGFKHLGLNIFVKPINPELVKYLE